MGTIETLSLAMGTAWTSGINLYATVAVLGLAASAGMIQLPPDLQILTHPVVISAACIMYIVEFFADKVPYVDNGWDVLHTFVRIPAGALLAAGAVGDVNPALEMAALLTGGAVATVAHGTKASIRMAANVSPEPFSNWFLSVGEDLAVLGSIWMVFHHPVAMILLVIGFTLVAAWLIPKLFRAARRGLQAIRARRRGERPVPAPLTTTAVTTPPA
jgi:hypothetical protein